MEPGAIGVLPYDLAAIVDPVGYGLGRAGGIDGGEGALMQEEAMVDAAAAEQAVGIGIRERDSGAER